MAIFLICREIKHLAIGELYDLKANKLIIWMIWKL